MGGWVGLVVYGKVEEIEAVRMCYCELGGWEKNEERERERENRDYITHPPTHPPSYLGSFGAEHLNIKSRPQAFDL